MAAGIHPPKIRPPKKSVTRNLGFMASPKSFRPKKTA
jgi:hypothetical protein